MKKSPAAFIILVSLFVLSATVLSFETLQEKKSPVPRAVLIPAPKFLFQSFVDCNMAEVWIGDTFRIFPGKYGEDPLWGYAHELKYADGLSVDEAFLREANEFTEPAMPPNALPGTAGLHGAVVRNCLPGCERCFR